LRWGKKDYHVDLGAEEVIAAEMSGRRIARAGADGGLRLYVVVFHLKKKEIIRWLP
jgi:hypothetical protein